MRNKSLSKALMGLLGFLYLFSALSAQTTQAGPKIEWHKGPYTANLGDAVLKVPEHFAFANGDDARKFMELNHNPPSGTEVGLLVPTGLRDDQDQWFVLFDYDQVGYINDEEKSDLHVDQLLKAITEGTEKGNEERKQRGWPSLHVIGWQTPPFYNQTTHNLTWATLAHSDNEKEGDVVNYSVRILGRQGTMRADLVVDPRSVSTVLPAFTGILSDFNYVTGMRYVDFAKGDKVAGYGLTALIAGGATAAAIKVGLFSKLWKILLVFWKFLLVGLAAAWAAVKKFFASLFGKKRTQQSVGEVENTEGSLKVSDNESPK